MRFNLLTFLKRGVPKTPAKIPRILIPHTVLKDDFQFTQALQQIKDGNVPFNWQALYDYDARTDGQPVYSGFAPSGVSQDINKEFMWIICKNEYDANGILASRKVATGKWVERKNYVYA